MARDAAQKIVDRHNENYRKIHPKFGEQSPKGFKSVEKWTLEEIMGEEYPTEQLGELQTVAGDDGTEQYNWTEYFCAGYYDCENSETVGFFQGTRDGIMTESIPFDASYLARASLTKLRELSPSTKVYYRARLKRNAVRAQVDMEKYGFSVNIPEIIAYSQAQPNKGNIKEKRPDYEARLAPLWQGYPNETSDSEYLRLQQEFKH